jgi:SnoaL-like domain
MTDLNVVVERYIATWNHTDPASRRKLIDDLWAEHGTYCDPLVEVTGPDAIDAVIGTAQAQFAGLEFTLGPVDAHHDVARFTWNLGQPAGEPIVVGFDVLTVDSGGRITAVLGFLDKIPVS